MIQHIKYNVRSPILPVANGISRFLHRVTFELIISKRLKAQVNYHFTLVEMFEIVKKKTPKKTKTQNPSILMYGNCPENRPGNNNRRLF